jgi:hypothetical protein
MKFSTLFIGGRPGPSMGRTAFWIILGIACYRWIIGQDIFPGHQLILLTVLGYTFSSKYIANKAERKEKLESSIEKTPN